MNEDPGSLVMKAQFSPSLQEFNVEKSAYFCLCVFFCKSIFSVISVKLFNYTFPQSTLQFHRLVSVLTSVPLTFLCINLLQSCRSNSPASRKS